MTNPIETLLAQLESDLPRLQQDMDASSTRRSEERAFKILALEDSPPVEARLMAMLRDAGIA